MEERQWSRMEWYPAQPRHYIIGAEHPPLCMALPVSPTIMPGLEMHCPGIAVSQTSQGNGSSRHAYKTTPRLTCSRTCHRVPPRKSSATLTFLSAPNPHPSATMPAAYRSTPLYGGALICELPTHFADVSTIRQVPDNQEVYIDKGGFTSIVFDITERVGGPGSTPQIDGEALTTHLEDIVGDEIDRTKVWNSAKTFFSRVDESIPAYTLIATQSPRPAEPRGGGSGAGGSSESSPDFTAIVLTLLRLEREKTDILITINVPHIKGEYDEDEVDLELGKQGKLIGDAVDYASKIWESFKVKDWTLFKEV
ncbi:Ran-interacting Mog1 protein [Microdochium nivale]|nr:Ran-interacting Mog1 protein [Microdochium nivale]